MADRRRIAARVLGAALAMLTAWPALAAPQPELDALRTRLAALDASLTRDSATRALPLQRLLADHGLDGLQARLTQAGAPPAPPRDARRVAPVPAGSAAAELIDFRIALAILSQSYSQEDNADVIAAQGRRGPMALSFRGGTVTLPDIRAAAARLAPQAGDGGTLRLPVVLWEDTQLRLSPGDRLALSRTDGAFVMSFGRTQIIGATLETVGDPNPHAPKFVPFLTVAGGGALQMQGATVRGLGFGWTEKFAGVALVSHPFMPSLGQSRIVDSQFEGIVTLVLSGKGDVDVTGNRFHDVRDNALRLTRAPRAQVRGNLFFGTAPTNAIRLLDRSDDAVISGNILLGGDRAGILIRDGSDRVQASGNVLWRRGGGGIKFLRTACGRAAGNILLDGRQKGIEVRASPGTAVSANLIAGAHSAALWVSDQPEGSLTQLTGNRLVANGTGLATATAGKLLMRGNDLTAQMPKLVDGDMIPQNAALIRDLTGAAPLLVSAGGAAPAPDLRPGPCQAGGTR